MWRARVGRDEGPETSKALLHTGEEGMPTAIGLVVMAGATNKEVACGASSDAKQPTMTTAAPAITPKANRHEAGKAERCSSSKY